MLTEDVLIDCVSMYVRLFGDMSSLMTVFAFRYWLFNPKAFPMQMAFKGIEIEDLKRFTRPQFLKEVLPRLRVQIGQLPTTH
jgi:hypothetical protein